MNKPFFLLAFLLFAQAGFAWWSDGTDWTARKPTILNSTLVLTDYQVKIELNWTSGMNATFTDLRFTDNSTNGVSLPFWIENYTASVNATVWVKTNLTTGNNTVYVYYNNPAALSASNGTNTFDLFDDFEDGDYTQNPAWIVGNDGATLSIQTDNTKYVQAYKVGGSTQLFKSTLYTAPIANAFVYEGKIYVSGSDVYAGILFKGSAADTFYLFYMQTGALNNLGFVRMNGGVRTDLAGTTGWGFSAATWYPFKLAMNSSGFINLTINNHNQNYSDSVLTTGGVGVGEFVYNTLTMKLDDVKVRGYASPEPAVLNVGAEETLLSISIQSPLNKTYNTATIDLNFTLSTNASSCIYELDGVNTTITGCQNTSIDVSKEYTYLNLSFGCDYSGTCYTGSDNNWTSTTNRNSAGTGFFYQNYSVLQPTTLNYAYKNYGGYGTGNVVGYYDGISWISFASTTNGDTCSNVRSVTIPSNITQPQQFRFFVHNISASIGLDFCEANVSGLNKSIDGSHSVKVWANDTANNWGVSSTVFFSVDTTLPSVTMQLPVNATYNKLNGSVTLNFTTSDNFGVSQCKYELDGVNTSLPTCSNTTLTLTDGSHRIKVWVNDTANNWNSTPLIYFINDFTEPNINIQSPTNSTYTISTVALNFTIGENVGLSTCKYELDGINTTISCTANTSITGLSHGGHSIKIWANDTTGNTNNSATISFSNNIVLYVYVYDETTPTQNVTFNLTISNNTASKTANNQGYYTGNFTADPRGSLTLTLSAAGYNSRTFYTTWDGTAKVNYTAYLLTGTNQYTFYIKNANSVAIEGAVVTIKRSINNVLQTVGEATTDTAGTVLFTLTPNIVYTVQVVASNYNTHTGTILPTQASYTYTITLSSSTSIPNFQQVWNGIRYSYQPAFTILKNTINTFNFTIYSIVDGLTSYGMNISVNGTVVSSQTGNTSTGGSITATVDLRNYTTEAGYARLWFTKTGMPTQVIQPDKNFNVYTNPTSNISAAAIAINFGNTTGITEQTKFMISVIISIIMMAVTAGFGAGRNGSAIIGLLVFGAFVWVGWVPALYLTFGILFVFAILVIKGAY